MKNTVISVSVALFHVTVAAAFDDRACWEHPTDRGTRSFVRENVAIDGSQTWALYWSNGVKSPIEFVEATRKYIELRNPDGGNRLRLFNNHGELQTLGRGPYRRFSRGGWSDGKRLAALKVYPEDSFAEAGLKLRRLLELGRHEEIERRIEADLASKRRSIGGSSFAWMTFDAMVDGDRPSPQLRLAVEWVQANSRSPYAHAAAALAQSEVGWNIRGNASSNNTDEQRLQRFAQTMETVRRHLDRALDLAPDNPIVLLLHMRNLRYRGGSGNEHRAAFEKILSVDDHFLQAYLERQAMLEPKWGGDATEMVLFSRTHLARVDEFPGLYVLAHHAHDSLAEMSLSRERYFQLGGIFDGLKRDYEALITAYPEAELYQDWYRETAGYAERRDEAEAFLASLEQ